MNIPTRNIDVTVRMVIPVLKLEWPNSRALSSFSFKSLTMSPSLVRTSSRMFCLRKTFTSARLSVRISRSILCTCCIARATSSTPATTTVLLVDLDVLLSLCLLKMVPFSFSIVVTVSLTTIFLSLVRWLSFSFFMSTVSEILVSKCSFC